MSARPPTALSPAEADAILGENFAPWVLALGIATVATSSDGAILRIPFRADLTRVGGTLCGQALAAGADTAMVIALAAAMGGFRPVTTVDLTTTFMRPIAKADAILQASVKRLGRTLAFCTCDIREDGSGKPVAHASATYAVLG